MSEENVQKKKLVKKGIPRHNVLSVFGLGQDFDWAVALVIFIFLIGCSAVYAYSLFDTTTMKIQEIGQPEIIQSQIEREAGRIEKIALLFAKREDTFKTVNGGIPFVTNDLEVADEDQEQTGSTATSTTATNATSTNTTDATSATTSESEAVNEAVSEIEEIN